VRLKSLEIKGFKSFADRTVIHFSDDVLGIVGPNGCGKSNVVDAIRWVLGEQKTKELRSEKMDNVIFNGTKDRKPAGVAEVALTLENTRNLLPTEYHTVTIKRLLYRTGESEYRINDVKCRLKDITNLLGDTGMGSDSYAIIALGMVDDLLSDREDARRRLFEQASGIGKYKVRKKETLAKLESADADLSRVEDLLFEIDANLKTLEKQARRAKRYFELKDEYKAISVELAVHRLAGYRKTYRELGEQIETEEKRRAELDAQINLAESELEKEKFGTLEQEKALAERQRGLNQLVGRIRNLENDKKVLSQKSLFVLESGTKLDDRIAAAERRAAQLVQDVERNSALLADENAVLAALAVSLEQARAEAERIRAGHAAAKGELDGFLRSQQEADRRVFELEKERAVCASRQENHRRDIERLKEGLERRREDLLIVRKQHDELGEKQRAQEAAVQQFEEQEAKRTADIADWEKQLEQLREESARINRALDAKRNEHKLTKSLVENLEGFPESIRFLATSGQWKSKAPLLSDIFYTQENYRTAIENYLEPYLNHYVVPDRASAVEAIRLLERSQKGKANFFLLEEVAEAPEPPALLLDALPALSVIETDAPYRPLARVLLGNVFFSDAPLPELLEFSRRHPEVVLLSPKGNVVKRRFSIGGGSVGLFEGKRIGRQKNLEVLEADIAKFEAKASELQSKLAETQASLQSLRQAALGPRIAQEKSALERIHREKLSLQGQLDSFERFEADTREKSAQAAEALEELSRTADRLSADWQTAAGEAETLRARIATADSSFRSVAEELGAANTAFNQLNIEHIRQQNKIGGYERELGFLQRQLNDTRRQVDDDRRARLEADAELGRVQTDVADIDRSLSELYEERRSAEKRLGEAETAYYASRGGVNQREDALRQLNRQRQDCLSLLGNLQNRFNDVKLELASLNERLRVEFELQVDELLERDPDPQFQREELEIRVEKTRAALANFGEVNPMAMEAYDEMKVRHDFIQAQREDLLRAKEALLQTIAEIDATARERFNTAFAQVRDNFQLVFRSLFTEGDTCDLVLTDAENPLESHINIIAKPKGKRPQTINQLSGGEKTLTATALLFSLYLLKPAPFCVFDEVDAPLDDANIDKFNRIIRKFSDKSQFIIVTHNKQTMAAVDIIYGVTMQKSGVSQVVPVDFRSL
jgi:chromosome segregation protein